LFRNCLHTKYRLNTKWKLAWKKAVQKTSTTAQESSKKKRPLVPNQLLAEHHFLWGPLTAAATRLCWSPWRGIWMSEDCCLLLPSYWNQQDTRPHRADFLLDCLTLPCPTEKKKDTSTAMSALQEACHLIGNDCVNNFPDNVSVVFLEDNFSHTFD
jgi:hypothetical protein